MQFLLRYWYLFAASLVLSLVLSVALTYSRVTALESIQPEPAPAVDESLTPQEVVAQNWFFTATELESLQLKLQDERARLDALSLDLENWQSLLQSEASELEKTKASIEAFRTRVTAELDALYRERVLLIEATEQRNLRNLANVYGEMKIGNVVNILNSQSVDDAVRVMAFMPNDLVARILNTMAEDPTPAAADRTNRIINRLKSVSQ